MSRIRPDHQLIPVSSENRVALYSPKSQLAVIYKPHERKLQVTSASVCPMCHRELPHSTNSEHIRPVQPHSMLAGGEGEYFRLLETLQSSQTNQSPRFEEATEHEHHHGDFSNMVYYERFFTHGKRIGTGGFGSVYLCQHKLEGVSLGTYAVKVVPVGTERSILLQRITEVRALERVRHPNIVSYKHCWIEPFQPADFGPRVPCLFILMEYADGGNLADYLWPVLGKRLMDQDTIWKYFIDVLLGLEYLHSSGIVHRDVKPQNLLLMSSYEAYSHHNTTRVVISDFGTSAIFGEQEGPRVGNTGTVHFMAPELFARDREGRFLFKHSDRSDMWGLGVILYAMCYGALPFDSDDIELVGEQIRKNERAPIPSVRRVSPELENLVEALLQPDPRRRPSSHDVLMMDSVQRWISALGKGQSVGGAPLPPMAEEDTSMYIMPRSPKHAPSYQITKIPSELNLESPSLISPRRNSRDAPQLPHVPVLELKSPTPPPSPARTVLTPQRSNPILEEVFHTLLLVFRLFCMAVICESSLSLWYIVPSVLLTVAAVICSSAKRHATTAVLVAIVIAQYSHAVSTLISGDCCSSFKPSFGALFGMAIVHTLLLIPALAAAVGRAFILRLAKQLGI